MIERSPPAAVAVVGDFHDRYDQVAAFVVDDSRRKELRLYHFRRRAREPSAPNCFSSIREVLGGFVHHLQKCLRFLTPYAQENSRA